MDAAAQISLSDLAERSGVPIRQIRALIGRRVLPRPSSRGRGAGYGDEHLIRLRAWKRLSDEAPAGTTVEQIRVVLDRLSPPVLAGIADGSVPFRLIDDGERSTTIRSRRSAAAFRSEVAAAESSRSGSRNEEALRVLRAEPAVLAVSQPTRRQARPSVTKDDAVQSELEVSLAAASAPDIEPLRRLGQALASFLAEGGGQASRLRPEAGAETWHRVAVGRDVRVEVRGPLDERGIDLLEQVAALAERIVRPPMAARKG